MKQEIIAGMIIGVIGLVMIGRPDMVYTVSEKWKNKNEQGPSDVYINTLRVVGVTFFSFGVILATHY